MATLKDMQSAKNGISFGVAVKNYLLDINSYSTLVIQEFNTITAEYEMKPADSWKSETNFDWSLGDKVLQFAADNKLKVRGHTLEWRLNVPDWLKTTNYTKEKYVKLLYNYVFSTVTHYEGLFPKVVFCWDVVNELIDDQGNIIVDNFWLQKIGIEYVSICFQAAHKASPSAALFYNDWGLECIDKKADRAVKLVQDLVSNNVPIHGVGIQCHWWDFNKVDQQKIKTNLQKFQDLGMIIHITELDVYIPKPITEAMLVKQGDIYEDLISAFLSCSAVENITFWGLTDKYSWFDSFQDGQYGAAHLFDKEYKNKPAYYGVQKSLVAHHKHDI